MRTGSQEDTHFKRYVPEGERFVTTDSRPEIFYNSGRQGYFVQPNRGDR